MSNYLKRAQERLESYKNRIYYFSESVGWMCSVSDKGTRYHIHNGNWDALRMKDGKFRLHPNQGEGVHGVFFDPAEVKWVREITDWVKIKFGDMTPDFRKKWYLPRLLTIDEIIEMLVWEDESENGIAF